VRARHNEFPNIVNIMKESYNFQVISIITHLLNIKVNGKINSALGSYYIFEIKK